MKISLIKKVKIIFSNSTKSIRRAVREVGSEFSLIIKNNKYSKSFPELFAIFSIIEQEQNTKLFTAQSKNFDLVNKDILKDVEVSPSDILNVLRGIFHNNKLPKKLSKIKLKMVKFLFNQAKEIINEKNEYNDCLIKVLLFEFPFLLSYSNHSILSSLISANRRGSNKIIKDVFLNSANLGFINDNDDLINFLNLSVTYNNKNIYMVVLKHIRKNRLNDILFERKNFEFRKRLLSSTILSRKGADFGSILLSFYQDKQFGNDDEILVDGYLKSIHDSRGDSKTKSTKSKNILKYLNLASSIGYKNRLINKHAQGVLGALGVSKSKSKVRCRGAAVVDIESALAPSTHVNSGTVLNIAKLSPEEYWIMNNSCYLA